MRYIVEDRFKKMYLANGYYRPNKEYTNNFYNAYRFSSFELNLASKTILNDKDRYIVYACENGQSIEDKLKSELN